MILKWVTCFSVPVFNHSELGIACGDTRWPSTWPRDRLDPGVVLLHPERRTSQWGWAAGDGTHHRWQDISPTTGHTQSSSWSLWSAIQNWWSFCCCASWCWWSFEFQATSAVRKCISETSRVITPAINEFITHSRSICSFMFQRWSEIRTNHFAEVWSSWEERVLCDVWRRTHWYVYCSYSTVSDKSSFKILMMEK